MSAPDDHDIICADLCMQFAPQTACILTDLCTQFAPQTECADTVSPPGSPGSPAAPPSSPEIPARSIAESDSDSDDTADYIVYPSSLADTHVFSDMAEFADILEQMPCAILRKSMQILDNLPTLDSIAECECE